MTITVSYFGNLIRYRSAPSSLRDQEEMVKGASLRDFCSDRDIPLKDISVYQCNGDNVTVDYIPEERDHIRLFGFVSGG